MAVTAQVDPSGFSAALIDADRWIVFAAAQAGNLAAVAQCMDQEPNFEVRARSTAAEGPTSVINLSTLGVPFAAGTLRILEIDFAVAGNAADETGWARHTVEVSGGTTPILRVVTLPATGPLQVGGNTLSGVAGAGLAATPAVSAVMSGNDVTICITSAEAEILNWVLRIKVRKAYPLILGV